MWKLKKGCEKKLRERRVEILMAGDGCENTMSEEDARSIMEDETVEEILYQDGELLEQTDSELFE